jgi:hypothetical protein
MDSTYTTNIVWAHYNHSLFAYFVSLCQMLGGNVPENSAKPNENTENTGLVKLWKKINIYFLNKRSLFQVSNRNMLKIITQIKNIMNYSKSEMCWMKLEKQKGP